MRSFHDGYLTEKTDRFEMYAAISMSPDEFHVISDSVSMTSDFDETPHWVPCEDHLVKCFQRVGMLTKIFVHDEHRGANHGNAMMQCFMTEISANTDIDILFARIDNGQRPGFCLQTFYEGYGFESVIKIGGELLMVNKGHANELRKLLLPLKHYVDNGDSF